MAEREAEDVRPSHERSDEATRSTSTIDLEELAMDTAGGETDTGGLDPAAETRARRTGVTGRLSAGLGRLFAPVRTRLGALFSPGSFLVGAGLSAIGVALLGWVLPFGGIGDLLGIAIMTFLYGLASEEGHYLEVGTAGAVVGGLWSVLGNLLLTLVSVGAPIVAVGVVGGAVAAVLGHYFGRDLRDGLTRDL